LSEGCLNCYASRFAHRLAHVDSPSISAKYKGLTNDDGTWNGKTRFVPEELTKPAHWKKAKRVFVGSMCDIFHESVGMDTVMRVIEAMYLAPQHSYLLLTKRPERMKEFFCTYLEGLRAFMPDTVAWATTQLWLGVTAENQKRADERIPILMQIPAAVRFVSCEPLLGEIDLIDAHQKAWDEFGHPMVDWVVVGGESGPGARPTNPDWVRNLRNDCHTAEVPFFFKSWGTGSALRDRLLDGKIYGELPNA
jgi:protein gp37